MGTGIRDITAAAGSGNGNLKSVRYAAARWSYRSTHRYAVAVDDYGSYSGKVVHNFVIQFDNYVIIEL